MCSYVMASVVGLMLVTAAAGGAAEIRNSPDPSLRPLLEDAARPFTGSIRIRQQGGDLYYDFKVKQGKVTGGTCGMQKRKGTMFDVVGGWYDRERLVLQLQSRGKDIRDKWFSHSHQFRRTQDGFKLEHTLFGFGQTIESGIVFQPHVIDRLEERK